MTSFKLKGWQFIIGIALWQVCFSVLSLYDINNYQLLNISGYIFLSIIPGFLTVLNLKINNLNIWGLLSLIVGFSILELMIVGLLINTFLPLIDFNQPLNKQVLLFGINLFVCFLEIIFLFRIKFVNFFVKKYLIFDNATDLFATVVPIFFVILSVLGAIRLNNGASNVLTMIMLGSVGVYIFIVSKYIKSFDENVIPAILFFISLALLLMNSLRGWYITGHDIQSEFKVFQLAINASYWNISNYKDAYNACLSITILPTFFSRLLSISDPYIYKLLFQPYFALCPSIVYLISRFWTSKKISFIGAVYFFSFTTFFADMPFLVRQEIAFLFYGLMLYIIFNSDLSILLRRIIFMLMGVGVILSHYSTTYTVLLVFGLVIITKPLYIKIVDKFRNYKFFENSALIYKSKTKQANKASINMLMVVSLFLLSFLWTSIITKTGDHAVDVVKETIVAVRNGFGSSSRSVDATSLVSFYKPDQNEQLRDYIKTTIDPIRNSFPAGIFYDESYYQKYPLVALPDEKTPLLRSGQILEKSGIRISHYIYIFTQLLAKILEILAPLGMIYLIFRNLLIKYVDDEMYLISAYALIFVFLNIVLPVLSVRYGIYRAIQQAMFIVSPIIAIANILIFIWIYNIFIKIMNIVRQRKVIISANFHEKENNAVILAIIFFLTSTSFISHLFGGNIANVYLDNAGRYYDNYLILTSEVQGVNWLKNATNRNLASVSGVRLDIQTDRYTRTKMASLSSMTPFNDIMPAVIRRNGYVFLGKPTVKKQRATIVYGGDQVTYNFPLVFLNENKNLIYSNGDASVYK